MYIRGAIFTVFLSHVIAFPGVNEDKTLKVKIGFDLTAGPNGVPSLQIRNFEEMTRKLNGDKEKLKKYLRTEFSSGSEEIENNNNNKEDKGKKRIPESDLSDNADNSGSEGDRRLSTKGLNPGDFEPENVPDIHERYKEQDSE